MLYKVAFARLVGLKIPDRSPDGFYRLGYFVFFGDVIDAGIQAGAAEFAAVLCIR